MRSTATDDELEKRLGAYQLAEAKADHTVTAIMTATMMAVRDRSKALRSAH